MNIGSMAGPLGSTQNYIVYIALGNCVDYFYLKKKHEEENLSSTSEKYKEVRYYLNAVESLNNILDYFYYENESSLSHHRNVESFRKSVHEKYSELETVANIANAYKHCVRENHKGKNTNLPWARDLQNPEIVVNMNLANKTTEVKFNFNWPIKEQEEALESAWKFWNSYQSDPISQELISA